MAAIKNLPDKKGWWVRWRRNDYGEFYPECFEYIAKCGYGEAYAESALFRGTVSRVRNGYWYGPLPLPKIQQEQGHG